MSSLAHLYNVTKTHLISQIILNHPKAYNALNLEMIVGIMNLLESYQDSSDVKAIIIRSSMNNIFCAGGDIKAAYYAKIDGNIAYLENFFKTEYRLNHLISTYQKPIFILINGLTLGGGMGLAMHAKYRVANEHAQLGMPETTIGFFTDVGAGHFYQKLPPPLNFYFSLTGATLDYNQALQYGLATHFVSKLQEEALLKDLELCQNENEIVTCLNQYHQMPPPVVPTLDIDIIDACFKDDSIEAIFERLKEHPSDFAQETLNLLLKKSPTSLKVVFELIKRSRMLSLKEILEQDFTLSQNFMNNPDCIEGIRAQIIDKDKNPKWAPGKFSQVTDEAVSKFFIVKPELKGLFEK
jgi:enoyl-CoA hydratase